MEYMEVIKNRRSIRKFKDTPVTEEALSDILESARLAPSGGNTQRWLFGVVTDKEIIRQLSVVAGNQEWITTAPLVIALCADLEEELSNIPEHDFGLTLEKVKYTPELIENLRNYPDQRSVSLLFLNGSTLIPGEHICLTAVNHGLGACWIGNLDIHKASEILDLPENYCCFFLIPIGYPDMEPCTIDRKSLSEITFKNKYER